MTAAEAGTVTDEGGWVREKLFSTPEREMMIEDHMRRLTATLAPAGRPFAAGDAVKVRTHDVGRCTACWTPATVVSVDGGGDGDGDVEIDADGAIVAADGAVVNVAFDEFIDEETNEKLIEEDVLASRVRPRFVPRRRRMDAARRGQIEYLQDDVWWECDVLMVDSTGVRGKAAGTRPGGQ